MTCIALVGNGKDRHPCGTLSEPGLLVCKRHRRQLGNDLAAISGLWSLLPVFIQPGAGTSGTHGKPGSRPPINLDVADILDPRGTVHQQLTSWARVVIEDRQLAARSLNADQAARLLAVHADWLAAQLFADEALAEIHDCAHRVRLVCGDLSHRWVVGTCSMPGPDGDDCGGDLQVVVQHIDRWDADRDDYDKRLRVDLVCRICGDTWTEADLDGYMSVNDVWLPIDDAAYQLGVTRRTLDRHAANGTIRRKRGMVSWSDARSATAQTPAIGL